jgi:L-alanine-DL-glutamate epimerase-like enolase superfamily enzyme
MDLLEKPFRIQIPPMKITRIETFCTAFVGFVRVTAEDGLQGWGQVAPYHADISCLILHRQVAPWALGWDADDIAGLVGMIPLREHKFPGSHLCRAIGGLDTALWDLRGKRLGRSVCELLGGTPRRIPAYASSMKRDITPEDEGRRLADLVQRHGFRACKFRVGAECGNDVDEWPGRTEAIIPAMRHALGPEVALLADGNSGFSVPRAIEVGRMLADHGVSHFEEPCPYWDLEATRQVTEALEIDVAGGEQDCLIQTWRQMIAQRAVDIIQPDVCYAGGMIRTMAIAALGAASGLPCTPHSANLSMVTLFTMHLLGAIPNPGKYLELSIEGPDYYPWQDGLFRNDPYKVTDGTVAIPEEPGWGVEIAPDWLGRSDHRESRL